MIGEPVVDKLQYNLRLALDGKGRDIAGELSTLMQNLPENIYKPIEGRKINTIDIAQKYYDSSTPSYSFMVKDGNIYQQKMFEVAEVPKENWQMAS